jgi:hypothetical protein
MAMDAINAAQDFEIEFKIPFYDCGVLSIRTAGAAVH